VQAHDLYAFYTYDIQDKFLVFLECTFNFAGKLVYADTNLNFYLLNSFVHTEYLRGGFYFDCRCPGSLDNSYFGEVVFDNNVV